MENKQTNKQKIQNKTKQNETNETKKHGKSKDGLLPKQGQLSALLFLLVAVSLFP